MLSDAVDEKVKDSIRRRMLHALLADRKELGLVEAARVSALKLTRGLPSPAQLAGLLSALEGNTPPTMPQTPRGPVVFVLEATGAHAIDVSTLLLHDDVLIRRAALRYLTNVEEGSSPLLLVSTLEVLRDLDAVIGQQEPDAWRQKAILAVESVQGDVFACLSGLTQALHANYHEGVSEFVTALFRPSLKLATGLVQHLSATEQDAGTIRSSIAKLSNCDSLYEALTSYLRSFGFLPLRSDLSAGEVVRAWKFQHPQFPLVWDDVQAIIIASGHPAAPFHLLSIGLTLSAEINGGAAGLTEAFEAEFTEACAWPPDRDWRALWQILSPLGRHLNKHLEALYPGEASGRWATSAWWLASEFLVRLAPFRGWAARVLPLILAQEASLSAARFAAARSPTLPTPLRGATITLQSLWGVALAVALFREKVDYSFGLGQTSASRVRALLRFSVARTSLVDPVEERLQIYAFQEFDATGLDRTDLHELLGEGWQLAITAARFRRGLSVAPTLTNCLSDLRTLIAEEQRTLCTFLRDQLVSGPSHDRVVADWLESAHDLPGVVLNLNEEALPMFLEMVYEAQQRVPIHWKSRLPQMLAFCLEQSSDERTAKLLVAYIALLSINGGTSSPLERIACSKWGKMVRRNLKPIRESLSSVTDHSEPWMRARIRAASCAISRICGPE